MLVIAPQDIKDILTQLKTEVKATEELLRVCQASATFLLVQNSPLAHLTGNKDWSGSRQATHKWRQGGRRASEGAGKEGQYHFERLTRHAVALLTTCLLPGTAVCYSGRKLLARERPQRTRTSKRKTLDQQVSHSYIRTPGIQADPLLCFPLWHPTRH